MAIPTDPNITKSKAWPMLDYSRWGFALCVVMIHVISLYKWDAPRALEFIINPSVPFFFIASGFLLGKKVNLQSQAYKRQETIKRYSWRILRMFLIWIAVYAPLAIASFWFSPHKEAAISTFIAVQLRSILLMGTEQYSWPTWYLYSLAIASFAIFLNEKFKIPKIIFMAMGALGILALHLGNLHSNELSSTIVNICLSLKNMTAGMLYSTLGFVLAASRMQSMRAIAISAGSLMLSICLFSFGLPYWEGFAGLAAFIASIGKASARRNPLGAYASKQSIWIFLLHMYVIVILFYFSPAKDLGPWGLWAIGCIATAVLSSLAIFAQRGDSTASRFMRKLT